MPYAPSGFAPQDFMGDIRMTNEQNIAFPAVFCVQAGKAVGRFGNVHGKTEAQKFPFQDFVDFRNILEVEGIAVLGDELFQKSDHVLFIFRTQFFDGFDQNKLPL
jgi:hypothetical protein